MVALRIKGKIYTNLAIRQELKKWPSWFVVNSLSLPCDITKNVIWSLKNSQLTVNMVKQTVLEIHCLVANVFWHMGMYYTIGSCLKSSLGDFHTPVMPMGWGVQPRPANTQPPSPRACGWVVLGPVATLGLGQP